MKTILKAIEATIHPDGSIRMDRPFAVSEPTRIIVTMACEEKEPNAETRRAMEQCLDGLKGQPRFDTVAELMADLES